MLKLAIIVPFISCLSRIIRNTLRMKDVSFSPIAATVQTFYARL